MPTLKTTLKKRVEPDEQAIKDILRENIKKFRQRRDLSQFALAQKLDISTNFLADIEAGNTWISALTLHKLAKAFDIEPYELLKPEKKDINSKEKKMLDSFSKDLAEVLKKSVDKSVDHLKKQYSIGQ
jgi:transcriptional regulator with XRE-family HTH domain